MDLNNQDIQEDAQGFIDSPGQYSNHRTQTGSGHMARRHPQTPTHAVRLQSEQRMPNNNMGGFSHFSGVPPEVEHFDVALVFAKEDFDLALEIKDKLSSFELKHDMHPKICLFDDECFDASQMCKAEMVVQMCTLIFVVLTENLHYDMAVQAVREEAFGLTRLAPKDECDSRRRYCVRPLHTKSEKDRKGVYKTPCGLLSIDSIDWYNNEKPSFKYKLEQLFNFHLPYRHKREKQDNCENPFQTAQLHGTQNINMHSMRGHLNMQSGQAMYQARMNEAPGTVQGNPSSGPPAGRVSENHRQGPGHGNISTQEIPPSGHRWTQPSGNTPSHQDNLPNAAQSQGSWDQQHGISPALNESSRQRFENQTTSHNPINHPGELSSSTHQESPQANGHDLSTDLNQMNLSVDNESVSGGVQECHESGSTGSEAAAQTSRSPPGALTGLPGPDTGDDHISEGHDDDLIGDGRSSGSHPIIPTFEKPSSAIKHSITCSEQSPSQNNISNSSQQGHPQNSTEDAHSSEPFQPLPEEDLLTEPDLDEDGLQTKSTKGEDNSSESSRRAKWEGKESTVPKSIDSSQGPHSSTDTTAIKVIDKKETGSVTSVKLSEVSDNRLSNTSALFAVEQTPCNNDREDNDTDSGISISGSLSISEQATLTSDGEPGKSPRKATANQGPCDDISSGQRSSNDIEKLPSSQGPIGDNGMDAFDHGPSNDGPRNHPGTVASGQGPKHPPGTVPSGQGPKHLPRTFASGEGPRNHPATVASGQGSRHQPGTVASGQGPRNPPGKVDHGPSNGSGTLAPGQGPSNSIDTVGSHQGSGSGSGQLADLEHGNGEVMDAGRKSPDSSPHSPPIALREPGDGQSLVDPGVAVSATRVPDKASKALEIDSAFSDKLKNPPAKDDIKEMNSEEITHVLKTEGVAHRPLMKCTAPNVAISSKEVRPTSPVQVIHYHYHAGSQGPGMFDRNVFDPLPGEYPRVTPLHNAGAPPYPGRPAASQAQYHQQRGPVNMSQQAPINIVNCQNVQIGADGRLTVGGQGERITDNEDEDPYDSLTSAAPNREDPPPPYSLHSPTSSLSATSRKTPLPDVSWIPSQTEPGGGNPPCSGQEAHTAGDSQSGTVSLGDASGLTPDGPRSSFPANRTASEAGQAQTGLSDLGANWDSGSGLSDITSLSVPDLGSASDFLEMVLSELSENGNSSHTEKGETTLPKACLKQNSDNFKSTTDHSSTPSTFNKSDMVFCASKRRKEVYLNTAKTLLQHCDFQSDANCKSGDSDID
ncbi:mucin-4-like [Haliotis rufescens]|uniref:mucin-4-like n=1 Tax=Haliotis rufescens TaxID=6454 RepID=UPI00201E9541|nr:mucin-4-like [Haliotis rufescens]XP_048252731.1 mucin-4-like [Haliotis rufescens]